MNNKEFDKKANELWEKHIKSLFKIVEEKTKEHFKEYLELLMKELTK